MEKSGTSHIARALRAPGSTSDPSLARGFRIRDWQVRPDRCQLERGQTSVALEPKAMGVLLCLAQHAPGVVTREQLIDQVWNGRVVSDEVLSRAISLLRGGLGDDPQDPRFIRTIARVGYELIPPVERIEPETAARTAAPGRRALAAGAMAAAVALAAAAWWWTARDAGSGDGPAAQALRLAVLPFDLLGSQSDQRYLADGLTEELTVSLARVEGLRVVARNSSLRFRSSDPDMEGIARALQASHLVTGSVRTDGRNLRVSVHLSDSATGTEMWAEVYDRGLDDLFGMQSEIAGAVTQALRRRLPVAGEATATRLARAPANADAYRRFLQGRQQLARRGEGGLRAAVAHFEAAVTSDPAFLRAHLALAYACSLLAEMIPAEAQAALARAERALAEVSHEAADSPEVQAARAALELERNRWAEADQAFRAALAASPDETELRLLYSQLLGATGQRDAALAEARLAAENDPLSPAAALRMAVLMLWADDDDTAAKHLAAARELGLAAGAAPEVSMLLLVRQGRFGELRQALQEVQRRRRQAEDWIPLAVAAMQDPARGREAGSAIAAAAAAGQLEELLQLGALVLVRDDERALALLQSRRTLRTKELEFLLSREAAGLRQLPGFGPLVAGLGLDAYWDRVGWPAQCARLEQGIRCR
jgi:TolB-like protein/DNA-binding winged helix-turn-helix (wHTH) protein